MIVGQKVNAEADFICQQNIPLLDVKYRLSVAKDQNLQIAASPQSSSSPSFSDARLPDHINGCSETIKDDELVPSIAQFFPTIRSGSCTDIGPRESMDDEHIQIDDLSAHLGTLINYPLKCAFYGVFDGHGGPDAAVFIKRNALRFFFEEAELPQISNIDSLFLKELENSHKKAFLLADRAMANECSVSGSCGTTALTAFILGRDLLVANAGDCRAVLCRKGIAVEMSNDHRPTNIVECKRVVQLGGYIDDGYLNGYLSVTRALGDWEFKLSLGSSSPLIAEPEFEHVTLTEDDEFLIIGCDGVWDVMSSQYAVSLVRRRLRRHNDPQQSAKEVVAEALCLSTSDNLTVIVISFRSPTRITESSPGRPQRLRFCSSSKESRSKLRNLVEGK